MEERPEAPKTAAATPFEQTAEAESIYQAPLNQPAPSQDVSIQWTASEFVAHQKTASWYVLLAAAAVGLTVLLYIITRDKVTAAVVLIGALFLGFYGSRQPRQIEYEINARAIRVGLKIYPYNAFQSFAVVPEGAFSVISFMPLKRFSMGLTIYYAPEDEEAIINLLSAQLPLEHKKPDAIDKLMRHIRF